MGADIEQELSGVFDRRGKERTKVCEIVGCVILFGEITFPDLRIGVRAQRTWLVLPVWLKFSSDKVRASSEKIVASLN